jgi:hypothetical protein
VIIDFTRLPLGTKVVLRNLNDSGSIAQVMRFDVTKWVKEKKKVPAIPPGLGRDSREEYGDPS